MKKINLIDEGATKNLGKIIADDIFSINKRSIEIHLEGDLGAGKTFLTRSIVLNSGWEGLVKSPTYTLCEEYDLGESLFLHIDLYRTNEQEDIHIFDLDRKTHTKKIIIIEWPEKLIKKRDFDLKISFKHEDDGREVQLSDTNDLFTKLNKFYE
tara:strand:+ start:6324 stop:6785 length:462 start_codon:yes stop_codon:yes gene_type:complete